MKILKIRELAVIICVLILMNGIVSYAAESVLLHANQESASSASLPVTDGYFTVWGSVSSASKYQVHFIVPNGPYNNAYDDKHAPGTSISPADCHVYLGSSTNLKLYGNSKDDQKRECIASGGIAD